MAVLQMKTLKAAAIHRHRLVEANSLSAQGVVVGSITGSSWRLPCSIDTRSRNSWGSCGRSMGSSINSNVHRPPQMICCFLIVLMIPNKSRPNQSNLPAGSWPFINRPELLICTKHLSRLSRVLVRILQTASREPANQPFPLISSARSLTESFPLVFVLLT